MRSAFILREIILSILIAAFLVSNIVYAQSDFEEITRLPDKVSSLGGGQQFTEKWPIPELKKRYRTIVLTATILTTIDIDQFIEDMNSNPRITMLSINTSLSRKYTAADIQTIPLHKLKYVKHLAYIHRTTKDVLIDHLIDWGELVNMPSLEYLYLEPFSINGYRGKEVDMPIDIAEKLAQKLRGYVNYGYGGEMDKVDINMETLGLIVHSKQKNQNFGILKKCKSVKNLIVNVDTLSAESISDLLTLENLEDLRLERPAIDHVEHLILNKNRLQLNSLRTLRCKSYNISLFQSIAPQINCLSIDAASKNPNDIESFLSSAFKLNELNIKIWKDSVLQFKLNPIMPLKKFKVSGELTELPDELCEFKELKELDLRYNKLKSLPECMSKLKALERVDISSNNLKHEPPFTKWSSLVSLNLDRNNISNISDNWCSNRNLKFLKLSNNPFKGSVESLSCLKNLLELDLSNTCITALPQNISKLKELEKLDVSRYSTSSLFEGAKFVCEEFLFQLPEGISELKNLRKLNLSKQKSLTTKDVEIALNTRSDSIEIIFSNGNIKSLPKGNWQNAGIKSLNLGGNEIEKYPVEFLNNTIPKLNLKGNKLGALNQNITSKTEKLIWQYLAGLDVSKELVERTDVIDAVVTVGNKFYYKAEDNPILKLLPLVLPLDTLEILSRINASNYGEALFNAKRYGEAQKYLSLAIKKQKEGCIIFSNGIADLYLKRHNCSLELKDTLSAINDLKTIQSDYGFFTGFAVFNLSLQVEDLEAINEWKPIVIEKLKANQAKDTSTVDILTELSILEIYLVTNDDQAFTKYEDYLSKLDLGSYEPIYKCLTLLNQVPKKTVQSDEILKLKTLIKVVKFENEKWSCDLVKHWSNQLSEFERAQVLELNVLICPENN